MPYFLQRHPIFSGAILLILAEALFAGVGASVKYLSGDLSQPQLVFFRNAFALLFMLPWLAKVGLAGLKTQRLPLHLARSILGLIAMYAFFLVLSNLPLAAAMMALLVAPFFVPLVAKIWLKEPISTKTKVAILLGFAGAALVLKPESSGGFNIYIALALACAAIVAYNKCAIRSMTRTEPSMRIVFYFAAIGTLLSALPLYGNWQVLSEKSWLILAAMGAMAALGQYLMTKAFELASPVTIGLLTYSSVIFAALLGYFFWSEPIHTGLIAGSVLIIVAANITIRQRWL